MVMAMYAAIGGLDMDLKFLQQHIRNLAIVKETDSPVVSCYLNLERGVVEIVNHSEDLMMYGGVGALRRFLLPDQHCCTGVGDYIALQNNSIALERQ
jgi:hypothetical protein